MTLPIERTQAVNRTREFLFTLIDPKQTPRVPASVRKHALSLIKHYPTQYDMDVIVSREDGDTNNQPKVFSQEWL